PTIRLINYSEVRGCFVLGDPILSSCCGLVQVQVLRTQQQSRWIVP
ncbi:Uncharacterized protein APZ42_006934, partial [Daphnia magna]